MLRTCTIWTSCSPRFILVYIQLIQLIDRHQNTQNFIPALTHALQKVILKGIKTLYTPIYFFFFFFNRHYNPYLGFGLLNYRWAFSAGRFYRVPLTAARQTPNLKENQGFRAFQLSPQETPSVWSDASEPSSGRWNYGREMAEKFAESGDFHVSFGFFYMP
jgi:hypothetical protein